MVSSIDILFRAATLVLFFLWWFYWAVTERVAEREKPKTKSTAFVKFQQQFRRIILRIAEGLVILQIIGLQLFQFHSYSLILQIIGFVLILIGVSISFSARKIIGTNWSHAFEYQIKKNQDLVMTGIYAYIRHPIYAGLCLALVGGELIAQSYLAVASLFLFVGGYWQARQEEALLSEHFGSTYKTYMKHTKMFIPFLW